MKKIFIFALLLICIACGGHQNQNQNQNDAKFPEQEVVDSTNCTEIEFENKVFDFGTILEGEQVSYTFKFKNVGNNPLLIKEVNTSCGCTVPEYDKKPIEPNGTGTINIKFDSNGKKGTQYKTIRVITNTIEENLELVVTGTVK